MSKTEIYYYALLGAGILINLLLGLVIHLLRQTQEDLRARLAEAEELLQEDTLRTSVFQPFRTELLGQLQRMEDRIASRLDGHEQRIQDNSTAVAHIQGHLTSKG